jgi:hypothetical protein
MAICTVFLATSCWIGDQDDPEILYDSTLIELMCQNPDISTFCQLTYLTSLIPPGTIGGGDGVDRVPSAAWKLQFSGRIIVDGVSCSSGVESVFAPDNNAWIEFFENYPHWNSIYDIPTDTVDLLIKHHIFLDGKLIRPNDPVDCATTPIILGSEGMPMWSGRWVFVRNQEGDVRALSEQSGRFLNQNIESPDLSSTDGSVYIINQVLGPF